jgi:hypothetical protein
VQEPAGLGGRERADDVAAAPDADDERLSRRRKQLVGVDHRGSSTAGRRAGS